MPYTFATPGPEDGLFDAARRLGDDNRKYVGQLTFEAWRDYAATGHILVIVDDTSPANSILGYAAFRTPRNEIVLAHLAVDPLARNTGVGHALIEELSRRFEMRRGIAASCRSDFPANSVWPRLGFVPLGTRPGRGVDRKPLTYWWRDHGHLDLMTWSGAPSSAVPVVLDANVFLDLHGTEPGAEADLTRRLLVDVLGDRLELLVTPEIYSEINRSKATAERARLRNVVESQYPRLPVAPGAFEKHRHALIDALGREPHSAQDRSDVAHVAYASAAGVPVVVSRDNPVLRRLRPAAAAATSVTIVSPEELVTFVDQAEAAPAYMPAALLGTGYSIKEAGPGDSELLRQMFSSGSGERLPDFERRLRALAALRPSSSRLLISAPDEHPVALLGLEASGPTMVATMLRMNPTSVQATLATQIGSLLRAHAAERGGRVIRLDDPHAHPLIREALQRDGFHDLDGYPTALAIPGAVTVAELPATLRSVVASAGSAGPSNPWAEAAHSLVADPDAGAALALERQMRPLCIVDAPVPTWLVPIKPQFSAQLFGYPLQLLSRPDELGISVEHVYYRGGRNGESAPGRILWFVSGPREGVVMGRSELVEVIDGPWEATYRQYRRLGVYRHADVEATADDKGEVRALHVINTQVFDRPLPLRQLQRFATETGARLQLQSPWRVSQELFSRIMKEVHA